MPAKTDWKVASLQRRRRGVRVMRPAVGGKVSGEVPARAPQAERRERALSLLRSLALVGLRRAEDAREEGLHAVPEGDRAITNVVPSVLRRRLGGFTGFFDLVACHLGAAHHRLAYALGGVFHAVTDLLASALNLLAAFLDLGVVRC